MNLVIDIGNTRIKIAVFDHTSLVYTDNFQASVVLSDIKSLTRKFNISNVILSHVTNIDKELLNQLQALFRVLILSHDTRLPFINNYLTPKTLGVDRLALVAGAVSQFPKENVLVIDAGSCITYDFVNTKSEYFGGSISPGIEMRYKAVNSYTANLNGVIHEIEGVIQGYTDKYRKLTVVLTGGDTIFLAKNLKSSIFATPNFLLEGLNSILIHNIDE